VRQVGTATSGAITIWFERFGSDDKPTVLLIQGAGGQAIGWTDEFCELLVAAGLSAVRFDNRDSGLSSTSTDDDLYSLSDMARDAVAVLDELHAERCHVVGVSLGGMIAQTLAIEHTTRVESLTSISTTPHAFDPMSRTPSEELVALTADMMDPPEDEIGRVEMGVRLARAMSGSAYEFDDTFQRSLQTELVRRAWNPDGMMRQGGAAISAEDRLEALCSIDLPVLVIHGTEDPVMPYDEGAILASAHPRGRLLTLTGVGHELPPQTWPAVIGAIANLAGVQP